MPTARDPVTGRMMRTIRPWTPDRWDEGLVDNHGRFRVYRPDYPRAYSGGYAMRAHVVWWLATGEVCGGNSEELHHRDHDRLNDTLDNLVRLTNSDHHRQHRTAETVRTVCAHCGRSFDALAFRVRDRGVKFCGQPCYQAHPKPKRVYKQRQTHCKRGHPIQGPEAVMFTTNLGRRGCLICKRISQRASWRRVDGAAKQRARRRKG